MDLKKSNEAAREIAKILNIDIANTHIQDINIELPTRGIATAVVRIVITKEQWEQIGKVSE